MAHKAVILAVDDTLASLKLLTDLLKEEGYEVHSAINGDVALRSALSDRPDLVLLDIRMDGMDGFDVCRRLKAHEETRGIPVIFVSALSATDEKLQGFELGAVDFVTKPFQREELLARVRTHLELMNLRHHLEEAVEDRTRRLQESEAKFRSITAAANDAIITMGPDARVLTWNTGAEQIFGFGASEAIGQELHSLIVPQDANAAFKHGFRHFLQTGSGPLIGKLSEVMAVRKSGEAFPVEVSLSALQMEGRWHAIGIIRDITGRKHAEENLLITASVFDNSQEAVMITDTDNVIIDVNTAFSRITGYSRDEVLGKDPKLLGSGLHDAMFYSAIWESLKRDRVWRGEIWNKRKSGEVYPELLSISAICDNDGKLLRYVSVFSDISSIKEHEAELIRVANYDALTGLPNRVLLGDRIKQAIAQASREQNMMAVCYLDLDGFKPVNDTMGHEAGDRVLNEIARRIEKTIRGGDTVARLGGDEFVVLLLGLNKGEESVATLERLLAAIAHPITVQNMSFTITASIGVSIYPLDDDDPDILLRHADQAMYVAKQTGRNRFFIYDPVLDRSARDQLVNLENIRCALTKREFVLHYQPKVNLRTGEIIGAEALIRWQHPERGLLSPAEFLPVIENHSLAIEVGEWVIESAMLQMEHWQAAGLDIKVSVNVGALQLQQENFIERLSEIVSAHPKISPDSLELEVLETSAIEDFIKISKVIDSCRDIGVLFALDDFGTGYSSLIYLKRLPAAIIKIDQSFVRDMLNDPDDIAILEGVLRLADAFHRKVIAEGVESTEHGTLLLQLGCELAQGYGIARPMPAHELPLWTARWRPEPAWVDLSPFSRDDLPLLFAGVEHRAWIMAIKSFLNGHRDAPPPLNHRQCRFGIWLENEGQMRYVHQPALHTIGHLHRQVHTLATELLELRAHGRNEELQARIGELDCLRDTLLEQLATMTYGHL